MDVGRDAIFFFLFFSRDRQFSILIGQDILKRLQTDVRGYFSTARVWYKMVGGGNNRWPQEYNVTIKY